MSELSFFGNYDVKETVVPTVAPTVEPTVAPTVTPPPYESATAYLFFEVGAAPYDPLNSSFSGGGEINYLDADTNNYTTSSFYLNDNRGECIINCYETAVVEIYNAYIDVQRAGEMERLYMKNIVCNGDISSYNPTGTMIPKFIGNNANINVTLNF